MLKTLIFAGALASLVPLAAPIAVQAQPRYWQDDQSYYQPRDYRGYERRRDYDDDDYRFRAQPYYSYGGVPLVRGHPAYDEYGPDPNGLRAADGHRIKCKLIDQWDGYYGQTVRRRQCW